VDGNCSHSAANTDADDVWKLLKWFDVGKDWKLGIDRFIQFCCVMIMVDWGLDMLYVLPVDDSKTIIDFLISSISLGGNDE
jgi:hypothetical protein